MYGRMDRVIDGFYLARNHPNGKTMKGVGITPEGIENNPVMYELLFELPWRKEKFTKEEWIKGYVKARYGVSDPYLLKAWEVLAATAYNCPRIQEGTTESVFCARPQEDVRSASSWGSSGMYYAPRDLRPAAEASDEASFAEQRYEGAAAVFSLSPRETEVFYLLLRGRSRAHIATELVPYQGHLSEGRRPHQARSHRSRRGPRGVGAGGFAILAGRL